jgi:hypothetical protein
VKRESVLVGALVVALAVAALSLAANLLLLRSGGPPPKKPAAAPTSAAVPVPTPAAAEPAPQPAEPPPAEASAAPIATPPTRVPDYVATMGDLLELLAPADRRAAPPPPRAFWPLPDIDPDGLRILESEKAPFDRLARDRALACRVPAFPADVQVVHLQIRSGTHVPVVLTPRAKGLFYRTVSLDVPGAPVALVVTGYDGIALRVQASPRTLLAGVHFHTYYPSVALGLPESKVSRQYSGDRDLGCDYRFPDEARIEGVLAYLGLAPGSLASPGADGVHLVAGAPPGTRVDGGRLGALFDPDMPAPSQYGLHVLQEKGYISRAGRSSDAVAPSASDPAFFAIRTRNEPWEVKRPFRLPEGLNGAHAATFVVAEGGPVPSGDPGHSGIVRRGR